MHTPCNALNIRVARSCQAFKIHPASVRCLTVLPLRRERRCKPFRIAQLFSVASWAAACWAARNAGASASWNEE